MIFVPYTKIQTATLIALYGYEYEKVKLSGKYGYGKYFRQRWAQGQTFINVEHDCIPWPGAIELLEACDKDWCVHNYSLPVHRAQDLEIVEAGGIPIGLAKFSAHLIAETQGCWDELVDWSHCDGHLADYLRARGFRPHQHFPSIVNANPVLLGLVNRTQI